MTENPMNEYQEVHHFYHHDDLCTMSVEISNTTRGKTYEVKVQGAVTKEQLENRIAEAREVLEIALGNFPDTN